MLPLNPRLIWTPFAAWLLACLAAPALAENTEKWLVGDAFRRQLDQNVGIVWAAESLRSKVDRLASSLRTAIWLDRRIDPSQEPEIQLGEMPLSRGLATIAARLNAGIGFTGPVVYLGPPEVARKIATVVALKEEEIARRPAEARSRLQRTKTWQWETLSTPRDLLAELAREAQVEIIGLDQIPHDLWSAGDLPPLSFAERMTLVLAGFDLTFELDQEGGRLRFVPIPESPSLTRSYPVRGDVPDVLRQLKSAAPTADLQREGSRIRVTGLWEDHDHIDRLLKGERVRTPPATASKESQTLYTMKGSASLGTVLENLRVQGKLNISVDPRAQNKLQDRVTFEAQNANLEQLISNVLRETGLKFEVTGKNVKIFVGN